MSSISIALDFRSFESVCSHDTYLIVDNFNQGFTFTVKIEALWSYPMVMLGPHDPTLSLKLNMSFSIQTKSKVSIHQDFHKASFSSVSFLQPFVDVNYQSHDRIVDWLENYYSKRFHMNGDGTIFYVFEWEYKQ